MSRLGAAAERLKSLALGGRSPDTGSDLQAERLGQTDRARPEGLLLWLLADSAAEAGPAPAVAGDLARRLGRPVHTLITTSRVEPLAPGAAAAATHQLAPVESQGSVQRFLDHWRPDFAVVVGLPARPQLIGAAQKRGIPMFQAFAERKPDHAQRAPGWLKSFHTCLAPSAAVANAFRAQLGAASVNVEITGPLSDTVYALPCNAAEADEIARLLGGRPVWLAADITPDETAAIEAAHRKAFRSAHRLLLILVPRLGEDAGAIGQMMESGGWRVGRRSEGDEPEPDLQVYIADTTEEFGLWYRLAPVSFMGGTLRPDGVPTDPFAPATLGSAVLHGPFTGEAPWRYRRLDALSASVLVRNADELGEAIVTLLAPDKAASLAQAGWAATTESAHVVERLSALMEEIQDAREGAL